MLVLAPVISYGLGQSFPKVPADGFAIATRGVMEVTVDQTGELESSQNAFALNKCEWSTQLLWIVSDGSFVNKGDVIARLDSSDLQQKAKAREVQVMAAATELQRAESDLEIQQLANESRLAKAELQTELTALELNGYQQAKYPQEQHQLQRNVVLANEALIRAQKRLEFTTRMVHLGYTDPQERETDRLSVVKAQQALDSAQSKLRVLTDYSHARKLAELTATTEEAQRGLRRAEAAGRAAVLSRQIRVQALRRSHAAQLAYLKRLQDSIDACTIRAPQSGEVIIARPSGSSAKTLEPGDRIYYLQPVAQVPDRSNIQVVLRVNESKIRQLEVGQSATISVDALPDERIRGHLSSVGSVPLQGRFPNYDLRDYQIVVKVDADDATMHKLAPGMTASVNILTNSAPDAVMVPHSAVVEVSGRRLVYVRAGDDVEPRDVQTGLANHETVEILAGLRAGEEVVLRPRTMCAERIAQLQATSVADAIRAFWE